MLPEHRKSIIRVLFSRRILVAFLMGFSSGLPLLLTIGVLQAWMKEKGVDLTWIGMISLVQLPYTWKFIWAPVLDRFTLPFLGRRRGWLLLAQLCLILSIAILGYSDPIKNVVTMVVAAILVSFFSASQDIVVDAYRREDLADEELGLGSSMYIYGYRLGMLLAQVDHAPPTSCKLSYRGEVCDKDTSLLSSAFAAGLMENAMESEVNIVNARVLLRERGIKLVEERSIDTDEFSSTITAEVVSDHRTSTAAGTLFGNGMPRLIQKGEHRLESYLHGILILFRHRDMPGVIGKLGTVFGKHRINIAHMSVGRGSNKPGTKAVGVLSLDAQPPAEAVAEILALEPVEAACVVNLPPAGEMPAWMGG